jgi:superfamily I DNA/RNA helicase
VRWVESEDVAAVVAEVGEALDVVMDEADHSPASILVATTTGSVRDQLIDDYGFVRWDDRDETTIVCENVHRVKGLEFDHVILATADPDVADDLLYVGISRAIISLTVVAPSAVVSRLGLLR